MPVTQLVDPPAASEELWTCMPILAAATDTSWAANSGIGAPVTCSPEDELAELLLEESSFRVESMGRFSARLGDLVSSPVKSTNNQINELTN